jgi:hypothetical protein
MASADNRGRRGPEEGYSENAGELRAALIDMFSEQRLAVLATQQSGAPYGNLVAFAATQDAKTLMFATGRSTRKFFNISNDNRIALVIDNRSNRIEDFHQAMAATAVGSAVEVGEPEREDLLEIYLRKHPYLSEFVASPTCALLKVDVEKYVVVYRFQNIIEIFPKNEPQLVP